MSELCWFLVGMALTAGAVVAWWWYVQKRFLWR